MKKTCITAIVVLLWGTSVHGTNLARVTQSGDGNSALTDQFGLANIILANQVATVPGSSLSNILTVRQIGLQTEPGIANFAGIEQIGGGSQVTVEQQGTYNLSTVYQDGRNISELNVIEQRGEWNSASLTQSGVGNFSGTFQNGNGNSSRTSQSGEENNGYVDQTSFPGSVSQVSELVQSGRANIGQVFQKGSGQSASIIQSGGENMGFVDQFGAVNDASVSQTGDNNSGEILQGNFYGEPRSANRAVIVQQSSSSQVGEFRINNYAYISQQGDGNWGEVLQIGELNDGVINQYTGLNQASILQSGERNQGYINQGGLEDSVYFQNNTATISQTGSGNIATVNQ